MAMTPQELRQAIGAYLDKGPDFLKFGGTSHFSEPTFIGFSADAQRVIVEEAHKRNRAAETHSTSIEGLRRVDCRRHRRHPASGAARRSSHSRRCREDDRRSQPELLDARQHHHRARLEAPSQNEGGSRRRSGPRPRRTARTPAREKTTSERRKEAADLGDDLEMRRANAQTLIRGRLPRHAQAPTATGPPRPNSRAHAQAGRNRIMASARSWPLKVWSELGMSPIAGHRRRTRNGAIGRARSEGLRHHRSRQVRRHRCC